MNREQFKTILSSIMLITWSIVFPSLYEYINADPQKVGPQTYTLFMPMVYIFSLLFFSLGCYFIYVLIKELKKTSL